MTKQKSSIRSQRLRSRKRIAAVRPHIWRRTHGWQWTVRFEGIMVTCGYVSWNGCSSHFFQRGYCGKIPKTITAFPTASWLKSLPNWRRAGSVLHTGLVSSLPNWPGILRIIRIRDCLSRLPTYRDVQRTELKKLQAAFVDGHHFQSGWFGFVLKNRAQHSIPRL